MRRSGDKPFFPPRDSWGVILTLSRLPFNPEAIISFKGLEVGKGGLLRSSVQHPNPAMFISSSTTDRHIYQYFGTLVCATIYLQRAANPHRTFLHADQSKVFGIGIRRFSIIKSTPVISHT